MSPPAVKLSARKSRYAAPLLPPIKVEFGKVWPKRLDSFPKNNPSKSTPLLIGLPVLSTLDGMPVRR